MKILDIIIVGFSRLKNKFNEFFGGHTPKGDYGTLDDLYRIKMKELKKINDASCKNNPFEKLSFESINKTKDKKKKWKTI